MTIHSIQDIHDVQKQNTIKKYQKPININKHTLTVDDISGHKELGHVGTNALSTCATCHVCHAESNCKELK